jgi:hypothetical protein
MRWNYRIFRHEMPGTRNLGIHETYYNEKGQVCAWTKDAQFGFYETADDLIVVLERMLEDIKRSKEDVLDINAPPEGDFEGEENEDT